MGWRVVYEASTIPGDPHFSYRDATHDVDRRGDDIRREETALGTLVTIDVEATSDLPTVSFTLVLPSINLGPNKQPVSLQTIGVRTTDHTTAFIPGPILGEGQTYETFELKGTARFVVP
ncbi:conserved hypothetical protein [uncultured Defluviicoccus sp.]|uniref:Uncharacterized protein n=1 Tax=metagenome TaxID=256318 RepID=A0A380TFX8_9ZZZZ|nr:conserved hypothetical protein [uncultured Defluviicoccus sp.]